MISQKEEYEIIDGTPVAIIWRKKDNEATDRCPFCHRTHYHGRGEGTRGIHCMPRIEKGFQVQGSERKRTFTAKDGTVLKAIDGYTIKHY